MLACSHVQGSNEAVAPGVLATLKVIFGKPTFALLVLQGLFGEILNVDVDPALAAGDRPQSNAKAFEDTMINISNPTTESTLHETTTTHVITPCIVALCR